MASKFQFITELYSRTLTKLTGDYESWTGFLRSACYNYKCPFDEQVLIYAQRPDATAVLELEKWNRQFGRWVNAGAAGIAVMDEAHGKGRLKHYFDITDTHATRISRSVPIWSMEPAYTEPVIETLEATFGTLAEKDNLPDAVLSASRNAVADNMPDYLRDLLDCRGGSMLEELDALNVEVTYRRALESSVAYMLLTRLSLPAAAYILPEDFEGIYSFDTPTTINALGIATSDIAEMGLREISRTVMQARREQFFAKDAQISYDDTANTMTVRMTDTGLSEINEATTVYADSVKRGYSDCTMRISYAATLTADAKMGDTDNPNEVVLTWRRTNNTYFDTLKDCCHVYTYGVDVLKRFSDNGGNMKNVKFRLHNDTDDCYIIADLKDGIYYAKGITSKKSDATTFIPNSSGHIVVKGLEDDAYSLTEIATDKGYVLLKDAVKIVIKTAESGQCEKCGAKLLTASATVNGKDVTMTDGNAIVPLTVVNNPGFDLPKTGGYGTWMFTIGGVALLGAAAFIVIRSRKHKDEQ